MVRQAGVRGDLASRASNVAIGLAREELVAIDQVEQRHGFSAQGMDDVSIVDDMAVLAGGWGRRAAG